jgi:tetratricopeptide (TPR) repeat protein
MERIEKLHNMLEQSPNDCFLWHALALEWLKIGDLAKARTHFEQVLSLDANYVGTYYHLGKTFEKLQLLPNAVSVYEEGIRRATTLNDRHARNELQQVLDDLSDE